jgi:hypothetical protein
MKAVIMVDKDKETEGVILVKAFKKDETSINMLVYTPKSLEFYKKARELKIKIFEVNLQKTTYKGAEAFGVQTIRCLNKKDVELMKNGGQKQENKPVEEENVKSEKTDVKQTEVKKGVEDQSIQSMITVDKEKEDGNMILVKALNPEQKRLNFIINTKDESEYFKKARALDVDAFNVSLQKTSLKGRDTYQVMEIACTHQKDLDLMATGEQEVVEEVTEVAKSTEEVSAANESTPETEADSQEIVTEADIEALSDEDEDDSEPDFGSEETDVVETTEIEENNEEVSTANESILEPEADSDATATKEDDEVLNTEDEDGSETVTEEDVESLSNEDENDSEPEFGIEEMSELDESDDTEPDFGEEAEETSLDLETSTEMTEENAAEAQVEMEVDDEPESDEDAEERPQIIRVIETVEYVPVRNFPVKQPDRHFKGYISIGDYLEKVNIKINADKKSENRYF